VLRARVTHRQFSAAATAANKPGEQRDQVREALVRDLEAARYATDRAFRQFDAADPANRHVAGELETRWNKALARVAEIEAKVAAHDAVTPSRSTAPISFETLADDLKAVWIARTTDARLKKRIVRTVIHEVVADIDADAAEIVLIIHWMGGVHTEIRLPRRRKGQRNSTAPDVIVAVQSLVLIANDDVIAGVLNRNKLVTGHGNRWTRERVASLRSHHRIPVYSPAPDGSEPWLNLTNAAALLGVSAKTLRLASESGEIEAIHPLADGPWIFSRSVLESAIGRAITERAKRGAKHPAGHDLDQQELFNSMT
jgi:hypothetical protein